MDLFEVKGSSPGLRLNAAVRLLGRIISAREVKALNAVEINVTTRWPSVSLSLAERAVSGVNQFNVESRKSQAASEAHFVGTLVAEAETALRDAEDRLQTFQQRNRVVASPELQFEQDRLERDVAIRQQMYTSLLQSREDARIREVRDTPVITVLEDPRLPVLPESRGAALRTVLGFLSGALVGVIAALFAHGLAGARRTPTEEAREFFELVEQATPRFLRRRHA
jgi:capsule polysaccharide export protein KpsE/RkpR